MQRVVSLLLAAGLLSACMDNSVEPAFDETPTLSQAQAAGAITVFDQNLYVGADIDQVFLALASPDPDDDVPALLQAITVLEATDFSARAAAIADEIARTHPAAVGFQELSTIDVVLPPLGVDVHLNFMDVIQAALAARGLDYDVAGRVVGLTASLPGVNLVDEDVILVDPAQVTVTGGVAQNFSTNAGPQLGGAVNLVRSYVIVTGTLHGRDIMFVETHPEPDLGGNDVTLLRAAQIGELMQVIGDAPRVVMMGDFNDVPGSPMYQIIRGAGFDDVWASLRPGADGFTCCHLADLSEEVPHLFKRIDYVFSRGIGQPEAGVQGRIDRFGEVPADRVAGPQYPIWQSDHAGLVARLLDR